ncbi:MAG: sel1 repeat family protein [Alphaproteobacteria bacterium]|nr:sel1 repeat family protein [Alphaproteobacteria bacterium]
MKKVIIVLFINLFFSSISYTQTPNPQLNKQLDEASRAFLAKNYETSFKLVEPLASQGEPIAQYLISLHYLNGFYVEKDLNQAFNWVNRSAEVGYPPALTQKANMLIVGQGVKKDLPEAFRTLLKASDAGDSDATSLACILFSQMTEPGEGAYHLCLLSKTYPFPLPSRMLQVEEIIAKVKPQLNTEQIRSAEAKVKAWQIRRWVYPAK